MIAASWPACGASAASMAGHSGSGSSQRGSDGPGTVGQGAQLVHREHERPVRVAVQAEIGDRQRAGGLAVIAVGEGGEAGPARLPALGLGLQRHLEGDLHGGRSVVRQEHAGEVPGTAARGRVRSPAIGQLAVGQRQQALAQAHQRFVRQAGDDDVFEAVQLLLQGRAQPGVAVAQRLAPPAGDGVQQAAPIGQVQPAALGAHHRQRRQRLVVPHLRAGMPEGIQIAGDQVVAWSSGKGLRRRIARRRWPRPSRRSWAGRPASAPRCPG